MGQGVVLAAQVLRKAPERSHPFAGGAGPGLSRGAFRLAAQVEHVGLQGQGIDSDAVFSNLLQSMATPLLLGNRHARELLTQALRAPSVPQPLQPFQVPVKGRLQVHAT